MQELSEAGGSVTILTWVLPCSCLGRLWASLAWEPMVSHLLKCTHIYWAKYVQGKTLEAFALYGCEDALFIVNIWVSNSQTIWLWLSVACARLPMSACVTAS